MSTDSIKTMKLYSAVDRIHADLAALGFGPDDPLDVDTLTPFDQLHYFGTDAVDHANATIGAGPGDSVLDVGAGFGGPARYLAKTSGASVTAVELQADLNDTALGLTARCGLSDRVSHIAGDILATDVSPGAHKGVMSFLALYHIPDRAALFPRLHDALQRGGVLYIEDLYARAPLDDEESGLMRNALYGNTVPSREAYVAEIEAAGFTDIVFTDMSAPWGAFCNERLAAFRAARSRKIATYGEPTTDALDEFYSTMCRMFAGGNMGGVTVTARKPG